MKVLITGAYGFIGKNLSVRLKETAKFDVLPFGRGDDDATLAETIAVADRIIHLAGENRPQSPEAFENVNVGLTEKICDIAQQLGKQSPILVASSVHAEVDNPYGRSKLAAEQCLCRLYDRNGNPVAIYRLPGVFGKWCKPNYNSVVATFCHNIANGLPIRIDDPDQSIRIVFIDDVVDAILEWLEKPAEGVARLSIEPEYVISLGDLSDKIISFKDSRTNLVTDQVGKGLTRALYATYVSYYSPQNFLYDVPFHGDLRGAFVEMLKTPDAGQFSYFTAHPGVTRGGHYHHTKTEKFLVVQGTARFGFRNIITQEKHFVETTASNPQVVETIPGWAHDITNIGADTLIVMLWANEIFDREKSDTIQSSV